MLILELHGQKKNDHVAQLANLIKTLFSKTDYSLQHLAAIAVSAGPGSYTGLRIGVSTAKGICHALDKPLILVNTLEAMVAGLAEYFDDDILFCPLIDARRMEVYTTLCNKNYFHFLAPGPQLLHENIFRSYLDKNRIVFFGSGLEKSKPYLQHSNAVFREEFSMISSFLIGPTLVKWKKGDFSHLAYSEPEYTKEVYTTTPKHI